MMWQYYIMLLKGVEGTSPPEIHCDPVTISIELLTRAKTPLTTEKATYIMRAPNTQKRRKNTIWE
jgi:hypothetical protein